MLTFFGIFILINMLFIIYMIYLNFNKLKKACKVTSAPNIVMPVDKNGITIIDGMNFGEINEITAIDTAKNEMNGTFNSIFT